jgi:hypothetical protein
MDPPVGIRRQPTSVLTRICRTIDVAGRVGRALY